MIAVRLNRGNDLKNGICRFLISKNVTSASVVSAVGSLSTVRLRMAGATPKKQDVRTYEGVFEIVSLIGTIDKNGEAHLHMSIADHEGRVIGGHVKDGCIVHTTAECSFVTDQKLVFERRNDPQTGFSELCIEEI